MITGKENKPQAAPQLGGSGGMSIGGAITGGTPPSVLFVGAGNVLSEDPGNFDYVSGTGLTVSNGSFINPSMVQQSAAVAYNAVVWDTATGILRTAPAVAQLGAVLDNTLSAPPVGPTIGDRYIVASPGVGAWVGLGNHIEQWDGAVWLDYVPVLNDQATVVAGPNAGNTYLFGAPTPAVWNLVPAIVTNAWSLGGNTNASLFTIGTNNAFDFPIVAGGIERMRFKVANGQIQLGQGALATGTDAFAFGKLAVAASTDSIVFGHGATGGSSTNDSIVMGTGAIANTSSAQSIAIGKGATTHFLDNIAIGRLSNAGAGILANGIAIGLSSNSVSADTIAFGNTASATSISAIAIGKNSLANAASSVSIGPSAGGAGVGTSSVTLGSASRASGASGIAIGNAALASGSDTIGIGTQVSVSGTNGIAIGNKSRANGLDSIMLGTNTGGAAAPSFSTKAIYIGNAGGTGAVNVGINATFIGSSIIAAASTLTLGTRSIMVGIPLTTTATTGVDSISMGTSAESTGLNAISIGLSTKAASAQSIHIGTITTAGTYTSATGSITMGQISSGSLASASNAVIIGNSQTLTATAGADSISLGTESVGTGARSILLGKSNTASGADSISIGTGGPGLGATATNAIAIGPSAAAVGISSIAFGESATANSAGDVAIGQGTQSSGGSATGVGTGAQAIGASSVAIGDTANVTANFGIAIGLATTSAGQSAIAMGFAATASAADAIAIGTTATTGSTGNEIAIGNGASAPTTGVGANIAIGSGSVANANGSLAIGDRANAISANSIAIGSGSTTTGSGQFVAGSGQAFGATITDVFFGKGVTATVPTDYTIHGTGGASGSNANGANVNLSGGLKDGTGVNGSIIIKVGRFQQRQGADVASPGGGDLFLGYDGNTFIISGTNTINALGKTDWQGGSHVTLIFSGVLTVKHNTAGGAGAVPIFLAGSVNLTTAANTVLGLVYDGTQWQETFRKVA